tara:strand:+ start:443 stop:649 length:207 start_codon:yes stop_codon:yes gene_type:complete
MSKMTGTVKWFDNKKGFGFIEKESGGDVFAHFSEIQSSGFKSLNENDKVEFVLKNDERGEKATDIVTI